MWLGLVTNVSTVSTNELGINVLKLLSIHTSLLHLLHELIQFTPHIRMTVPLKCVPSAYSFQRGDWRHTSAVSLK